MKIHNEISQGSQEWFDLRAGKLTASKAQAIATAGKGLETLCYEVMAEKYSSAEHESYSNEDMERGHELEEAAREMYELQIGNKIETIGFVEMDEYVGASPDGKIQGQNGGAEIKCKKDSTYLRAIIEEKIDSGYMWQMQMQMLVTGWDFIDFIDYNPNLKCSMKITRIEKDSEKQEKLKLGIAKGVEMLKEIDKKYNNLLK
jgi:putative phage-type endonuclease